MEKNELTSGAQDSDGVTALKIKELEGQVETLTTDKTALDEKTAKLDEL